MTIAAPYTAPPAQDHRKAHVYLRSEGGAVALRTNELGHGYLLQTGVEGLGVADVENVMEDLAHGSTLLAQRMTAGEIFLPVLSRTTSNTALKEMRRELSRVLRPARGGVEVIVLDPTTGEQRVRECYYRTGLGAPEWRSPVSEVHGLVLEYAEPLWRGAPRSQSWSLSNVIKPYWTRYPRLPHYPAWLSSSTVLGRREFTVSGDAPAYPIWTFHGTGEDLLIECGHCGSRIYIDGLIPDGLVIDTRPQVEDITAPGWEPADLWQKVSDDSSLFHFEPGAQEVTMSVVKATGNTLLEMQYAEQWLAGY